MACIGIPQIKYREFSEYIHNKTALNRLPINGSLEINFSCNLKCMHCYCPDPFNRRQMSFEEIRSIIDGIEKAGCLWLTITGGEPLLRADFKDIYLYAKRKGLIITLFTNATLLTEGLADFLKEYPPFAVEVSLYGATKKTYEKITAVEGSYERCLRGINLLKKREIPLRLKTMLMQANKHELEGMKQFAKKLGYEFRFDPFLNPKLDGNKTPCSLRISPEEILELDIADEKRKKGWQDFCEKFPKPVKTDFLYACSAGRSSFHIDPQGRLCLCIIVREPAYDLLCGSFEEGWGKFFPEILKRKKSSACECSECELRDLCGTCAGWSELENGREEEVVDYLCKVAHLRAKEFGFGRYKKTGLSV